MSKWITPEDSQNIQQSARNRRLAAEREDKDILERLEFISHWEDYCEGNDKYYLPDDRDDYEGRRLEGE